MLPQAKRASVTQNGSTA